MQQLLLQIWERDRNAVVFITHDEALFLSDRIMLLSERPARRKEAIENNLPRPRSRRLVFTQEYDDLKSKVYERVTEHRQPRAVVRGDDGPP